MAYDILKGSSGTALVFLMVQSSDHITGLTGATVTVTLSKNGGAFASPSGAVSEIANGWYKVAGNATDSNTAGPLALHATATSGDPTDVVVGNVIDATAAVYGGNLVNIAGSAVSTTTAQLGVNVASINSVAATSVTTISANQGTTQPVNFSGTGSTAYVKSDTEQLNAQAVTAAAGVTFPASVASPTNITAGTITTVTNLTNAPTAGDFTATMKSSLNSSTPASVTTVTGNVNGSVGSVTGAVGSVTGNVGGNVTGSVGSISGVTFPTHFSVLAIDASGNVTYNNAASPSVAAIWAGSTIAIDGSGFITYNNAAPPSAASIASTLLGTAVDGSFTVAQSARLVNAALWGQISGAVAGSSGTALLQSASTSATTRLTITYDSNGNRTGVTVNNDS